MKSPIGPCAQPGLGFAGSTQESRSSARRPQFSVRASAHPQTGECSRSVLQRNTIGDRCDGDILAHGSQQAIDCVGHPLNGTQIGKVGPGWRLNEGISVLNSAADEDVEQRSAEKHTASSRPGWCVLSVVEWRMEIYATRRCSLRRTSAAHMSVRIVVRGPFGGLVAAAELAKARESLVGFLHLQFAARLYGHSVCSHGLFRS